MRRFLSIAGNAFTQTIRQPIFFVLLMGTFLVLVMDLPVAGWTMGEGGGEFHQTDQRQLENMGLSTLLLAGVLLSAFSASSALSREIEDKTALTVVSKPVSRATFLLGKFAGVAVAVSLAYYLCTLVLLLTVRHQVVSAASESMDWPVIVFGCSAFAAAIILSLAGNYLFGWSFTSASIWGQTILMTLAMALVLFIGQDWQIVRPGYQATPRALEDTLKVELKPGIAVDDFKLHAEAARFHVDRVDGNSMLYLRVSPGMGGRDKALDDLKTWKDVALAEVVYEPPAITGQLLKGIVLTYMGVLVFIAVAVTASTRLGQVMTLLICFAVFMLGSLGPLLAQYHDFLPAKILSWLLPYLNYFYSTDVMSQPAGTETPARFIAYAGAYCLLYVGAVLALGVALFQRRQLAADTASASLPGLVSLLAGLGRLTALAVGMAGVILGMNRVYWHPAGLAAAAALVAIGVLGWLLWGFFARGAKWAYFLVLAGAALQLIAAVAHLIAPETFHRLGVGQDFAQVILGTLVAAVMLAILVLPKTRHHFFHS